VRASEAVGRALAQLGVRDFFGLVGSGNFHLANALQASGARFVAARHETGAVTMADAYARASGRLGVCTVHQGPGVTNALTGLTEAAKSRTPLLLLAAEATAPLSNFFIDEARLAEVAGAVHRRLTSPGAAVEEVAEAARIAVVERKTVLLSLPLDVQAGESEPPAGLREPVVNGGQPAPAADVEAMARLLRSARRPLLLAGRGAVLSEARGALEKLAEQTGSLLATSAVAYGIFAGNPWNLGISGGFSSPLTAGRRQRSARWTSTEWQLALIGLSTRRSSATAPPPRERSAKRWALITRRAGEPMTWPSGSGMAAGASSPSRTCRATAASTRAR
jgi:acetolactate synthase I/II/III large subunit